MTQYRPQRLLALMAVLPLLANGCGGSGSSPPSPDEIAGALHDEIRMVRHDFFVLGVTVTCTERGSGGYRCAAKTDPPPKPEVEDYDVKCDSDTCTYKATGEFRTRVIQRAYTPPRHPSGSFDAP